MYCAKISIDLGRDSRGIQSIKILKRDFNKEEDKMKITVINGSPRVNGNTEIMADEFIRGAKEAGHEVGHTWGLW